MGLVSLPPGKSTVGCRWVYTVKVGPDGQVDRLKARLVAKGTPGQGMLYENKGHTQIVGYTDVDWAGSPLDRRSTSGYCVFIEGNLIS